MLQCFCYTDIGVLTAESLESHTERLRELFHILHESNLSALQDRMPYLQNTRGGILILATLL